VRVVDSEGFVNLHGNRYSAPVAMLSREVTVHEAASRARLPRSPAPSSPSTLAWTTDSRRPRSTLPEHRDGRRWRHGQSAPPMLERSGVMRAASPAIAAWLDAAAARGAPPPASCAHAHRLWMDSPVEPLERALATATEHGLFEVARIETMALRELAGTYFRLDPRDDDDPGGDDERVPTTNSNSCSPPSSSSGSRRSSSASCARGEGAPELPRAPRAAAARGDRGAARAAHQLPHPPREAARAVDARDLPLRPAAGGARGDVKQLAELDFIAQRRNVVFIGPTGTGKTGLASAIVLKRPAERVPVPLREGAGPLRRAVLVGGRPVLAAVLNHLSRLDLLLIDEMGYLNLRPEQTNLFFKLMEERYNRRSTIITTNLDYDAWYDFLGRKEMVSALLDRLRHRCTTIADRGQLAPIAGAVAGPAVAPMGPLGGREDQRSGDPPT
jgi:hypothetical protein